MWVVLEDLEQKPLAQLHTHPEERTNCAVPHVPAEECTQAYVEEDNEDQRRVGPRARRRLGHGMELLQADVEELLARRAPGSD